MIYCEHSTVLYGGVSWKEAIVAPSCRTKVSLWGFFSRERQVARISKGLFDLNWELTLHQISRNNLENNSFTISGFPESETKYSRIRFRPVMSLSPNFAENFDHNEAATSGCCCSVGGADLGFVAAAVVVGVQVFAVVVRNSTFQFLKTFCLSSKNKIKAEGLRCGSLLVNQMDSYSKGCTGSGFECCWLK